MTSISRRLSYTAIPILVVIASSFIPIYPKWQPIVAVTINILVLATLGLNAFWSSLTVALFCLVAPIAFFAVGAIYGGQPADLISGFVSQYVDRWPEMLDYVVGPFLPILVYVVTRKATMGEKGPAKRNKQGTDHE